MRRACLIGLACVCLLLVSAGCTGPMSKVPGVKQLGKISGLTPSEEEQVASVLSDAARGMEARRVNQVLSHVSKNYHDAEGRDYAGMESYLNRVFKDYRELRITRVAPRVTVMGDRAQAVETFGMVAEPRDASVDPPVNLQGRVMVTLERVGGKWQILEWGSLF